MEQQPRDTGRAGELERLQALADELSPGQYRIAITVDEPAAGATAREREVYAVQDVTTGAVLYRDADPDKVRRYLHEHGPIA